MSLKIFNIVLPDGNILKQVKGKNKKEAILEEIKEHKNITLVNKKKKKYTSFYLNKKNKIKKSKDFNSLNWISKYNNFDKFNIMKLKLKKSWKNIFQQIYSDDEINKINKDIIKILKLNNFKEQDIFPYPDLIFNSFNYFNPEETKVVILGQDPYFNNEVVRINKQKFTVPQATGMSFSVNKYVKEPSSLKNIYKNLLLNKQIEEYPYHGNLESWAKQGVLLLNSSLTVSQKKPNSHQNIWKDFTNKIIKYLSDNQTNIVFVLWGRNSLEKKELINNRKHKIIISSHPSGLSCNKKMMHYPAFNNNNHFNLINEYLIKNNKKIINWNIN